MHSMTQQDTLVVGGVDAHADTHHVAALDQRGALLATKSFPTTTPGYRELLDWLSSFGEIDVVAVESTGSYAAALVRYLREHDVRVVEVNQPHAHTRRRVGKSDPIDAEMAARLFLAGKAKAVPKQTDGIVESIRLLRVSAPQRREVPQRRDRSAPRPASSPPRKSSAISSLTARRSAARPPSARDFGPRPTSSAPRLKPRSSRCARSRSGSRRSIRRSRPSTASSSSSSALAAPRTDPAARHLDRARRPAPRHRRAEHRTTARRELLRRCSAARARSRPPPARRPAIASTTAVTAKPTARCT